MKSFTSLPVILWIVVVISVARAWDLVTVWRHSPLDRFGWLAFLLWALPAFFAAARRAPRRNFLSALALALVVAATVTDRHAFGHCALAVSIGAMAGLSLGSVVWLISSVGWMPALTWVGLNLSGPAMAGMRFAIVAIGMAFLIRELRRAGPVPSPRS